MSERIPAGGPFKASVGLHESLNMDHLLEAKRVLANYCSTFNKFCAKYIDLISDTSKLVAKTRIDDLMWKEDYTGIDAGVFDLIRRLVEMYSEYIAGFYLMSEDRVAVRVQKSFRLGKVFLEEEEIVFLPVREAMSLSLAELVEPVRSNLIRLQREVLKKAEEDKGG